MQLKKLWLTIFLTKLSKMSIEISGSLICEDIPVNTIRTDKSRTLKKIQFESVPCDTLSLY